MRDFTGKGRKMGVIMLRVFVESNQKIKYSSQFCRLLHLTYGIFLNPAGGLGGGFGAPPPIGPI
jgi:hypothetical protein